jgi:hypothetical protein
MKITDADKEHIALLLVTGNKSGAVRHIQDTYSVSLEEARTVAEKLEARHVVRGPGEAGAVSWKVTGIIFTVLGFVLLSLGFGFGFRDYSVTMHSLPVTGRVVALEISDAGSSRTYTPVVEYFLGGKSLHMKTSASIHPTHLVGEEVELLVDPRKPLDPALNSFLERWFLILMLAGTGLFFSIAGFGVRKMMTARSSYY